MPWKIINILLTQIFHFDNNWSLRPKGSYIEAKDWIMERFVGSSINLEQISLKSNINRSLCSSRCPQKCLQEKSPPEKTPTRKLPHGKLIPENMLRTKFVPWKIAPQRNALLVVAIFWGTVSPRGTIFQGYFS